ncbi:hypothetical protein WJX79_011115 [Trebouxia sp. C0005]
MTSQKERPNVLQLLRGDAVQEDSDSKKREQQPLVIEHFIRMKKALPEIKREIVVAGVQKCEYGEHSAWTCTCVLGNLAGHKFQARRCLASASLAHHRAGPMLR